jgi:hypothetical protein
MLLIEQKAGFLSETPEGLVKNYPGRTEHVRQQMLQMVEGLAARFNKTGGDRLDVDYLLYFPDYKVKNPAPGPRWKRPSTACPFRHPGCTMC